MIDGDHDSKPDVGRYEHPDSIRTKLDGMTAERDALKSTMAEAAREYEEQIVALKAEVDRLSYAGQNAIVKHDEEVARLREALEEARHFVDLHATDHDRKRCAFERCACSTLRKIDAAFAQSGGKGGTA
jgi:hypothetical protein